MSQLTLFQGDSLVNHFQSLVKKRGIEDDRYLWPEMFRVIKEFKPSWVVGENVANLKNLALENACIDLESEGYEVQTLNIPAFAVNAPHRRDRLWILAYNDSERRERS